MDNLIEGITSFSPWIKRDLSIWNEITKGCTPITYKKNNILIEQQKVSPNVFIIKSGRVRVTISDSEGFEKHIIIAEEGCVIGEESCVLGIPSSTTATTIVFTTVYRIPKQDFINAIYDSVDLNNKVMDLIAIKNQILIEQISNLSFSRIINRVAVSVLNLVRQYGIKTKYGYRINIKFTHQDVANLTNSSRVMVSNIFKQLSDEGIIKRIDGYITVLDIKELNTRYLKSL